MSADAAKAAFEVIRDRMADGGAVEKVLLLLLLRLRVTSMILVKYS